MLCEQQQCWLKLLGTAHMLASDGALCLTLCRCASRRPCRLRAEQKRPQPLACGTGLVDAWPRATATAKHQTALDRLRRLQLLVPTRTKECAPCRQGVCAAREVVRVLVCYAVQGGLTRYPSRLVACSLRSVL